MKMNLSPSLNNLQGTPEGTDSSLSTNSSAMMMAVGLMSIKSEEEEVQGVVMKQELEDKVANVEVNDAVLPPNIFTQMARYAAPVVGTIREYSLNLFTRTELMPTNGVATITCRTPPRLFVRFDPHAGEIYITQKDAMGQITRNQLIFSRGMNTYQQPWSSPVGTPALITIQIDNWLYSMAFCRNADRLHALQNIHHCFV